MDHLDMSLDNDTKSLITLLIAAFEPIMANRVP